VEFLENQYLFLGVFYAKLQEVTISFIMFDRLSAWNSSSHIGWIFIKSNI